MKNKKKSGKKVETKIEQTVNGTYKCHICDKELQGAGAAIEHMLYHSASAIGAVNDLIKSQKAGDFSTEDSRKENSRRTLDEGGEKTKDRKGRGIKAVRVA